MADSNKNNISGDALYKEYKLHLLLPSWVMLCIFMLIPIMLMVSFSFLTKEFRGGVIWDFTLTAYDQFFLDRGLFGDEPVKFEWTYINIFFRSIVLALVTTIICLLIGFPTSYYMATCTDRQKAIWLFLVTIPYWINLLIRTISLKFLIRDNGPINDFLLAINVIDSPLGLINTNFAIFLGLFYSYLPFMVLPIYASMERYNFTLSEAAADLYASKSTTLFKIVIPVIKPSIIAGCILVFVPSLGSFYVPDLLGGAQTLMIGSLIWEQFAGSAGNWPFGAASATILLSMILVVLIFYARQQQKEQGL